MLQSFLNSWYYYIPSVVVLIIGLVSLLRIRWMKDTVDYGKKYIYEKRIIKRITGRVALIMLAIALIGRLAAKKEIVDAFAVFVWLFWTVITIIRMEQSE